MLEIGQYYMHSQAMDVCTQVLADEGNGQYAVVWYNLGYVGQPWRLGLPPEKIYMRPDVWSRCD